MTISASGIWIVRTSQERGQDRQVPRAGLPVTNPRGKNSFVPGRFAMTCCVQDIQFVGPLLRRLQGAGQRAWVTVTAKVDYKFHNIYRGKGPVLTAISVEPAEKPLNDVNILLTTTSKE